MYVPTGASRQWADLRRLALGRRGRTVGVRTDAIADPRDAGGYPSVGLPVGQDFDVRFPPERDCRGVHAQLFGAQWRVHVDEVHPACDLGEHLRRDAPGAWVLTSAALGTALGLLVGRNSGAALSGALLGTIFGALTSSRARASEPEPESS